MPFSLLLGLSGFCCLNSNPQRNKNLIFTVEQTLPHARSPIPIPIPLCLIYGQIIQIKQRGACAVSATLYWIFGCICCWVS